MTEEAVIWCPRCKEAMGKIMRKQIREEVYTFHRVPSNLPPKCRRCESVLERKHAAYA